MKDEKQHEYSAPTGAITLLLIYVLVIILMWGSVYLTLLSRGVTQ